MSAPPPLVVISGPTASGKSALAMQLAGRLPVEIISADSVQAYRGLDIGSAKPTAAEQRQVRHHLLDMVEPAGHMDAGLFQMLADQAIAACLGRGKMPLVVGGTGLYIRALLQGLLEAPSPDAGYRRALEERARNLGWQALHAELARVDAAAAALVQPNDRQRIQRALEFHHLTGRRWSEARREHGFQKPRYGYRHYAVDLPRAVLFDRINRRAREMVASGLVEEVRGLLAAGVPPDCPALRTLSYRHAVGYLQGRQEMDRMLELMARDHRRYAKRQMTWLRGERDVCWRQHPVDAAALAGEIHSFFRANGWGARHDGTGDA